MSITVSHLFVYPLKSAAAVSVASAQIAARGLARDRRWMVIQPDGRFLTGRRYPMLTQIQAALGPDGLQLRGLDGSVQPVARPPEDGPQRSVTVWGDQVAGHLADSSASAWLSAQLGVDCRLVYMADQTQRPVDPDYAAPGDVVSFADGFPLLLTTDGSLADLNQRLGAPVGMGRFRPNIVLSGVPAYAEDGWTAIRVGGVALDVVKPCARCVFTTVDPQTGAPDPVREPLRTLATYRRVDGGVMFGQNLTVRRPGRIAVGDPVEVVTGTSAPPAC
jgi:hypothetical protein